MKFDWLDSLEFLRNKNNAPIYALGKYSGKIFTANTFFLVFYSRTNDLVKIDPASFKNKNYMLDPFKCYVIVSKNNYLEIVKCIGQGTEQFLPITLSANEFYFTQSCLL